MDLEQLRLVARGGLLSIADADRLGIDRRELARFARQGEITRLARGWYTPETGGRAEQMHALRAVAGSLGHPGWVISHHSGLIVRDIPTFRTPLQTVRFVATKEPRRTPTGVVVRPRGSMPLEQVTVGPHEVPCLTVATCIVHSGLVGTAVSALVSADAALAAGRTTRADIGAAVEEAAGHRGIRAVRRALEWADPRHESPGESRLAFALHHLGYAFTPQVWIGGDRVDALLDDVPVVLEFDGALKYDGRADLVREKRREDRIRARGYEFVRRGWGDVGDLDALDRAIRQAIRRTRR